MNHSFVTAALPFKAARAEAVRQLLDGMGNPPQADIAARLNATNCIHFMSMHVPPSDGEDAYLIIDASVDGGPDTSVKQLAAALDKELRELIEAAHIDPYGKTIAGLLASHLIEVSNGWFRNPGLDFDGSPRMSVQRIRDEAALANRIACMLDPPSGPEALPTLQRIRAELWDEEANKWAFFAEPAPFITGVPPAPPLTVKSVLVALATLLWPVLLWSIPVGGLVWWLWGADAGVGAGLLTFAAVLFLRGVPPPDHVTESIIWVAVELMFWPLLLAMLIVGGIVWPFAGVGWAAAAAGATLVVEALALVAGYFVFRHKEKTDQPENEAPAAKLVQEMMQRESFTAQNLLAAVSTVKPGWIRRITLRFGLAAAGAAAQFYSRPGFLTDIGVIHFARWFCLPGTDKLMFLSNHDGAWESYLEDFIERGFKGVTGIWSNTVGFPKTHQLLNGGARDGDRLRRWTRRQMFPARFWYTAYPALTLLRIRNNAEIRQGLATARTEAQAAHWLSLFGSMPKPDHRIGRSMTDPDMPPETPLPSHPKIDLADMPVLLFGSLSHLRFGTILLVRLDPGSADTWLREIKDRIAFGSSQRDAEGAVVLGLSCGGLQKLGLREDEIATFPVAFQQGNDAAWRARAIGDSGFNAPEHWSWGASSKTVDAALLVYARSQPELDESAAERAHEIERFGHEIVHQVRFREVPEKDSVRSAEPFGYVDGISQPIIRGLRDHIPADQRHQAVQPGEFILGYRDNQGYVPPTPTVLARHDPHNTLPAAPPTAGWPPGNGSATPHEARHDLGRNGTFLVVRQLEQNVDAFTGFLQQQATALAGDPRVPAPGQVPVADWLGAKIVGRWKDGSSLVAHRERPGGGQPDNDFTYGSNDVGGLSCPLGAHIRRANPRDSFDPGNKTQLKITNRHRILRVGRPYAAQNGRKNPGLMFMCLNVDLDRQFEFVQQTWLMSRSFHGLENENDTMLNERGTKNLFTIPTANGPLRVRNMSDFITVLGGAYFFLPGRHALQYLAR